MLLFGVSGSGAQSDFSVCGVVVLSNSPSFLSASFASFGSLFFSGALHPTATQSEPLGGGIGGLTYAAMV